MRYYEIVTSGRDWTSHPYGRNGIADPGALNVELDLPLYPQDNPTEDGGWVRIWGIGLQDIVQNSAGGGGGADFMGSDIVIQGGMARPGLPLANPAEQGPLVKGFIWQSFANWVGTDMTLEFIIRAGKGPRTATPDLSFNWTKGQLLADAIRATLSHAFPSVSLDIRIRPIICQEDQPGHYYTLKEFAQYIRQISIQYVNNPNQGGGAPGVALSPEGVPDVSGSTAGSTDNSYKGVSIYQQNYGIQVYDSNTSLGAKPILYQDLIGQPTWINNVDEGPSISVKTILRGDLLVGDNITLPPTRINISSAGTGSLLNYYVGFDGTIRILSLRHIGNFRQPSPDSWCTVITGYAASPLGIVDLTGGGGEGIGNIPGLY